MLEAVLFGSGEMTGIVHKLALSRAFCILRRTLHFMSWETESSIRQ